MPLQDMKLTTTARQLQIQTMLVAICLMIFEAHRSNLFIINMKIFLLIKWSYKSSNHVDY